MIRKGVSKLLKRINAVNVCGAVAFLSMIAMVGFVDGGNHAGAVISFCAFAVFACVAVREEGTRKQKNRPH